VLKAIQRQLVSVEAKSHSKSARVEDLKNERAALRDLHVTLKAQDAAASAAFHTG